MTLKITDLYSMGFIIFIYWQRKAVNEILVNGLWKGGLKDVNIQSHKQRKAVNEIEVNNFTKRN